MKKFLLGTVGLIALAAPASAADLGRPYTKAPAAVAAVYDWSGFYLGLNAGGASARNCWDVTSADLGAGLVPVNPAVREGCHDSTGAVVGGQLGYRWQAANWVFGLEAQGDWASLSGSNASAFVPGGFVTNRSKIDAIGLFTGQVGYSFSNALWYVKGGAAVTSNKFEGLTTATGVVGDRSSGSRWGAVVGTGLEFGFAPNWSVGVEYNHLFMGSKDQSFAEVGPGTVDRIDNIKQGVDMVTARVNYRWGGPVVAKY